MSMIIIQIHYCMQCCIQSNCQYIYWYPMHMDVFFVHNTQLSPNFNGWFWLFSLECLILCNILVMSFCGSSIYIDPSKHTKCLHVWMSLSSSIHVIIKVILNSGSNLTSQWIESPYFQLLHVVTILYWFISI